MAKVYYEWVVELVDEHGDIHDTAAWDSAMDALDWMLYAQKSIDEGFYQGMAITKKFHLDMAITYNLDDECEGLIDQAHAYVVEGKVPQHFDNGRKIPKKLMNEYAKAVQKVLRMRSPRSRRTKMSDFTNGAHECFCDRKYKDANKLASCGDCPRDYIAGAWDARRKYIEEHSKMTDRQITHGHDSGQPLTQELLNSIMRNPGENRATAAPALPKCPRCEERYCGDGVQLCTECAAPMRGTD